MTIKEAFNRVHESNMSKLTGGKLVKDKLTGKVLKPETFKRVYLEDLSRLHPDKIREITQFIKNQNQ